MKKLKTVLIVSVTLLFIASCGNSTSTESKKDSHDNHGGHAEHTGNITVTKKQFDSNKMKLGIISLQDFPEVIKTTGVIEVPPQNISVISAIMGGYVKKSSLLIGDKVRKGQALVTIENTEFIEIQQQYLESKEQLKYLKSEFERQKQLADENITARKNFLKAESEYKTTLAKYNAMKKKLQMLNINVNSVENGNITSSVTIYAPISGNVTELNIVHGVHISPSDVIMEIVNTDHIHIELFVFEKDIMKIKKDQVIRFRIPESSDETYEAEVYLVGTSIDPKTRTARVHGHLHKDLKNKFAMGMFVDAEIITKSTKLLALPENAIIEDNEDENMVMVFNELAHGEYFFTNKHVDIGKTHNGFTEVIGFESVDSTVFLIKGGYSLTGMEGAGHVH